MTGVSVRGNLNTDRYRENSMARSTGRRRPSTSYRKKLRTDPSLRALRRNQYYQYLNLVLPASGTVRK